MKGENYSMKKKLKKGMLSLSLSMAMLIGLLPTAAVHAEEDEPQPSIGMWYPTWAEPEEEDSGSSEAKIEMHFVNFIEEYNNNNQPCALLKDEEHESYYVALKDEVKDEDVFNNAAVSWDGNQLTLNNYSVDYTDYEQYFEDWMWYDDDNCASPIVEVMNTGASIVVKGECSITWNKGNALSMYFDEGYEQQSGTLSILKGTDDASLTLSTSGRHTDSEETEDNWPWMPLSIGGDTSEFINEVELTLATNGKSAEESDWWDMDMAGEYAEDRFHNTGTINGVYPMGPDIIYIDGDGNINLETDWEYWEYWKVSYGRLTRATAEDYQLHYDSENNTLELNNFVYDETQGLPIYVDGDLTLKLTGTNRVTAWSGRAIMIEGDLTIVGEGSLEAVTTCENEIDWDTGEPGVNEDGEPWGAPAALSINGNRFSNECTLAFRAHENAGADLDLWLVPMDNLINNGTITGRWCAADADGVNMPESQEPDPDESPDPSESPEPSTSPAPSESPEPSTSPEPSESPEPSTSPEPSESPEPSTSVEPSTSPKPSTSPEPSTSKSTSKSKTPAVDWSATASNLTTTASGENLNVVTGEKIEVPQNVLQTVRDSGTTLALHTGKGVTFSITQDNLTDDMINGSLNLSTTVGDSNIPDDMVNQKATGAVLTKEISMTSRSEFGGVVNIHWALGSENFGKYANLYRYDETSGQLEYVGIFMINEDGQAMFGIVDGADYLLTVTAAKPDEEMKVLSTDQYVVMKGDTLSGIAARHSMGLEKILSLNPNIKNPNRIFAGQKIRVQ